MASNVLKDATKATKEWLDRHRYRLVGILGVLLITLILVQWVASGEPDVVGGPLMVRRLTEEQYRATIADVFSPDIPVNGRFEAPARTQGLVSVGTSTSGMSPFAVEQYDIAAQGIASAVLSSTHRKKFLPCLIKDPKAFDAKCARVPDRKGALAVPSPAPARRSG